MRNLEAQPKRMIYLLDQIEQGDLALPDFQRDFVWPSYSVRELLVSVFSNYPAGAILLLQNGASAFRPRPVNKAPALKGHPAFLALDGQQRLTSLYQASRGVGSYRYYLNLADLLANLTAGVEYDIDEAVEVYATRRAGRWQSPDGQATDLMLPLEQIARWADWKDEIVKLRADKTPSGEPLSPVLNQLHRDVVSRFEDYHFAVTTLAHDTSMDAVCSIFETINRTGIKLDVFELLTARAFAEGSNLRELWEAAKATHSILEDYAVAPYYLLQIIALRCGRGVKRSDILALKPSEITAEWTEAARGLAEAYALVRDNCGVFNANWLPYAASVTTIGAVWPAVESRIGPDRGTAREKLKRWFWVTSFAAHFENAVNTRTLDAYRALNDWLDGGLAPDYVETFTTRPSWTEITPRQRSLYRATMALLLSRRPLDFHTGQALTTQLIASEQIDDHHVFPQHYLATTKPARYEQVDCILNRTLIDRTTNNNIRAKAPSQYLNEMVTATSQDKVAAVLESHRLPTASDGPLFTDRFADYLDERSAILDRLLLAAVS